MNNALNQALKKHLANNQDQSPRIAVVGIGNEFNADDAAGVLAIRQLQRLLPSHDNLILIEGAVAPENFTGTLRKFKPDWVWMIDAAEMGEKPGNVSLLDWEKVQGVSAITHGLPPTLFARYVMQEFNTKVFLFGIQPEFVDAYTAPTKTIQQSVRGLVNFLSEWLSENDLA